MNRKTLNGQCTLVQADLKKFKENEKIKVKLQSLAHYELWKWTQSLAHSKIFTKIWNLNVSNKWSGTLARILRKKNLIFENT